MRLVFRGQLGDRERFRRTLSNWERSQRERMGRVFGSENPELFTDAQGRT